MNTKNTNEQVTVDLPTEETSENIKTEQKVKKVTTKKETTKTKSLTTEEKQATSRKKTPKKETKATSSSVHKDENSGEEVVVEKKKAPSKKTSKKTGTVKTVKKEVAASEGAQISTSKKAKTNIKEETANKKAGSKSKANRELTKEMNKQKEINISSMMEEVETTPVDETKPIVEDIKRFKLFFVSDMDDEAVYLHDMSLQGYHFVTKKGMQYIFRQGEPKNYYYHLGYYEKDKRDGDRYLDNYVEAGWENIFHEKAEFDGMWNYFRIEMPINAQEPNIFSDRVSRLALYKRLLSGWRSLLAVDVICFIFLIFVYFFLSSHPSNLTGLFMTLCVILCITIILIFVIYLRAYRKISRKQEELQNI